MSFKLRTGLVLIFILLSLVLSIVLGLVLNRYSAHSVKEEIGESLSSTAYDTADKLDNFMWTRSGEMDMLARTNGPETLAALVVLPMRAVPEDDLVLSDCWLRTGLVPLDEVLANDAPGCMVKA